MAKKLSLLLVLALGLGVGMVACQTTAPPTVEVAEEEPEELPPSPPSLVENDDEGELLTTALLVFDGPCLSRPLLWGQYGCRKHHWFVGWTLIWPHGPHVRFCHYSIYHESYRSWGPWHYSTAPNICNRG
jgi:hypothetical protein